MKQFILSLFILLSFTSCRDIEENFLYDSNDPRIIDLQKRKCLKEAIYTELKLVNDFSRFSVNKSYLFKQTSKVGDGEATVEAQWGVIISNINPGTNMTVSIRKPNEVYHLTYDLATSEAIVDIVTNGTCIKDKYARSTKKQSIKFTHTLRKIITASDDPDRNPPRYDEYKRAFNLDTEFPALFYYFRGSVTEKKIKDGSTTATTTYTHSISELDCTNSNNAKYCNLTGNAEDGTPLVIYNCNTIIPDPNIYNKETVTNNGSEASLVRFTPTTDSCNNIIF